MYQQQQERETEQIIGVVTAVVQKGADKWQAVVQPDGSQYTKNLWTKDANLIAFLSTQIGQRQAFACNVSHWNMQDGTPVRSLWIEAVGPSAQGSPALQGPPQGAGYVPQQQAGYMPQQQTAPPIPPPPSIPPPQPPQPSQDIKEQRIHRQTASKVAAILLTHVPQEERTLSSLFVMAERLVAYYNDGLPNAETLDDLMHRAMPASIDETPPDTDSDIPF